MCLPVFHRIRVRVDAHRTQDGLPELFLRLGHRHPGEDLRRPARRRHGDDTPGILVAHEALAVLQQGRTRRLIRERQLLRRDVLEDLGIARRDGDKGRALRRIILVERAPPRGELREELRLAMGIADMRTLFIAPAHHHIVRPRCEGRLADGPGKVRAGNRRIDHENLVRLQVHAHLYHQLCIFYQKFLLCHHDLLSPLPIEKGRCRPF